MTQEYPTPMFVRCETLLECCNALRRLADERGCVAFYVRLCEDDEGGVVIGGYDDLSFKPIVAVFAGELQADRRGVREAALDRVLASDEVEQCGVDANGEPRYRAVRREENGE